MLLALSTSSSHSSMSDSIYTGTVYLDLLQDEDYYRLGVCHWAMVGTTMEIKTNEMMFNPHISSDKIAAQQSQTTYFAKADYENSARGGIATGSPNRGLFKPDSRADIFSMGLSAKESFR